MLTLKEKIHLVYLRSLGYTYGELIKKWYTNRKIADTMRQDSLMEMVLLLDEDNRMLRQNAERTWPLLLISYCFGFLIGAAVFLFL